MRITENHGVIAFKDLNIGDVFGAMGYKYLKITNPGNSRLDAVNLNTNCMAVIDDYEDCVLLDAELVIYGEAK